MVGMRLKDKEEVITGAGKSNNGFRDNNGDRRRKTSTESMWARKSYSENIFKT